MNTIRRTIRKFDERGTEHGLVFEGESGAFMLLVEEFSSLGGLQAARIDLNKQEAEKLIDALQKFLK